MDQRVLGDYYIIKSIGQGTLGSVYLAEHRYMKRQYVLKILPEELSQDRGFIQRFEEEIVQLSSLEHPNIVKIHNISYAQGQYFLVTDCIVDKLGETTNLAQYLLSIDNCLSEDEILAILKQVADALDFAHYKKIGKGLVHRGLKLNNILVGKGLEEIQIFLSDFGLSKIIGTGAVLTRIFKNIAETVEVHSTPTLQRTGLDRFPNPPIDQQKLIPIHNSFLQNFAFLAPEQKRIDSPHAIDHKVDVYAFGVLTYYLLMNELPEGIFDMPSDRKEYKHNWDPLLLQCLQNDPMKRPENLTEALESITHFEKISEKKFNFSTIDLSSASIPVNTNFETSETNEIFISSPVHSGEKNHLEFNGDKKTALLEEPAVQDRQVVQNEESVSPLKPFLQVTQLERPQSDLDPTTLFQVDSTIKIYNPERKDITNIKPLMTDMVVVSGNKFYRGSLDGNRDEMPRHEILLSSFAIDIHPVTNEQFVRFLEVMGGEKDSNHNDIIRLRDSRIKRTAGKLSIESGYTKHPVVGVTWYGAIAYAKWVGKRLPTEAEWEIAARGGRENALYPTGDEMERTMANFFSSDTTAVMSYAPNGYNIYDMAGNVYEWCYDWYGYNYYELSIQEPENPQGPLQGVYRVLRGGCWKSLKEDLRCSRRHRNNPGTVNGTYGFRCAADVH